MLAAYLATRPCFENRLRSSSRLLTISVWGEGIFLTSSGRCWSRSPATAFDVLKSVLA